MTNLWEQPGHCATSSPNNNNILCAADKNLVNYFNLFLADIENLSWKTEYKVHCPVLLTLHAALQQNIWSLQPAVCISAAACSDPVMGLMVDMVQPQRIERIWGTRMHPTFSNQSTITNHGFQLYLSNYPSALSINNKMFTLLLNMIHQPPNGVIYITITTKKFLL